jgi:hypothetical membrane protein
MDVYSSMKFDSPAAVLAVSGIVAPVWFMVVVILQGLLRPDYSHVAMTVSALAVGPYGWIQNVNFYVFGLLMIAYALGLHVGMRFTRAALLGPAVLVLSGVGIVLAGVFPLGRDANGAIIQTSSHVIPSILAFSCAGFGLVVISWRMNRDPAWKGLAGYALGSGLAILALFLVMIGSAAPDDGPLHPWFGLVQRVVLAVWFPCTIVLSLRLLRIAKSRSSTASA